MMAVPTPEGYGLAAPLGHRRRHPRPTRFARMPVRFRGDPALGRLFDAVDPDKRKAIPAQNRFRTFRTTPA